MIGEVPSARQPEARQAVAVTLRQGRGDDLDAVMEIMSSAFEASFGEAWTRSQCAGILPMAGVALRLASDERSRVTGFSLIRSIAGEAELLLIAVSPAAQQRGIGRILVEDFISEAVMHGVHRLHLEVREGNPAIALYERAGFSTAGRRRAYYHGPGGETRDALTLARDV
ncbi:MAG: ribosomal protein S18-alanine N-acetyltransferase [Sphingomonas bacterium]|nr:ribosomal protein S18-alanine N-acetyltransferase [Sphingomonas bacterium]